MWITLEPQTTLKYQGKSFGPGDTIEVDDALATQLISGRSATAAAAPEKPAARAKHKE